MESFRNQCTALQLCPGLDNIPRHKNYTYKDKPLEIQEEPLDELQIFKVLKRDCG